MKTCAHSDWRNRESGDGGMRYEISASLVVSVWGNRLLPIDVSQLYQVHNRPSIGQALTGIKHTLLDSYDSANSHHQFQKRRSLKDDRT